MELVSLLEIGEWIWKHLKPKKVLLVVEDNASDALRLSEDLSEGKIAHKLAKNGEDAMLLMRTNRFSVALIDMGLPGMSGVQLADKIRKKGYKTRIVFVTGTSFINLDEGQHLNVIRKPVDMQTVREIII